MYLYELRFNPNSKTNPIPMISNEPVPHNKLATKRKYLALYKDCIKHKPEYVRFSKITDDSAYIGISGDTYIRLNKGTLFYEIGSETEIKLVESIRREKLKSKLCKLVKQANITRINEYLFDDIIELLTNLPE